MKQTVLVLATLVALATPAHAQGSAADAAYQRAAALVRDGQGGLGRQIVDSMFVRARAGTPEHAEALYWRAALASDTEQAERDYRRLVVEYPISEHVERALLALAQLELARNDRERALLHLQRLEREHPAGDERARAAFWIARIRFDMNDEPRACAALADAGRLASEADVELHNQVAYYAPRCASVAMPQPATDQPPAAPATEPSPDAQRPTPGAELPTPFAIQIAAYNTRAEADALVRRLAARGVTARVAGTVKPFRVRTGNFATRAEATVRLRELKEQKIEGYILDESTTNTP